MKIFACRRPLNLASFLKNRDASIKIYSDAVFDRSNTKVHGPDIRYGLDYELTPDFTFRVGANQTHYSFGASFDLFALSVDYAYKQSKKRWSGCNLCVGI